ncbi:MAG: endonuclease III [Oscillospiraceae bacterium]
MTKKERALLVCDTLDEIYPDAECSLTYDEPYQLLFAVRLSAQCTDARVNIVTKELFKKYPDLQSFADADISELENIIRPCGFFRAKAKSIKETAAMLIERFNSEVPSDMNDLLTLSGVGRKTANLIRGDVFGLPAIVADTHCIRISGRLGFTESKDPVKVEMDLLPIIPAERSSRFCHQLVQFGRDVCNARKPLCENCKMKSFCPFYVKNNKK